MRGRTSVGIAAALITTLTLPAISRQASAAPQAALSGPARVNAMANAVLDRLVVVTDAHWHKGEYNHIVNISRMIVAARPDDYDTYGNAGWLLWSMGRDDEAVALYKQGAQANPHSGYMYDELGYYYYNRKKDYPRAVEYYEKAIAQKDCPPVSYHMLAHAYEKVGRLNRAYATWKRAATMDNNPTRAAAALNMERVRRLLANQDRPR